MGCSSSLKENDLKEQIGASMTKKENDLKEENKNKENAKIDGIKEKKFEVIKKEKSIKKNSKIMSPYEIKQNNSIIILKENNNLDIINIENKPIIKKLILSSNKLSNKKNQIY